MATRAVVLGIAGAAIAGWIVTPVVDLARRGTLDDRTVRAWRGEGRPRRRPAVPCAPVPDPRRPDEPSRPVDEPTGAP
ncbi:hypothetical protein ACQPX6_25525 [Actinomycetospora sp. CA-101289]|uniref:hypothetical protein n=1 Tax=Actinomycetospora sp. CA-101289 TaxID=3239893 RepID=UPI003D95F00C